MLLLILIICQILEVLIYFARMAHQDFFRQDILTTEQFSKEDILHICDVAKSFEMIAQKQETSELLKGKLMASLFYEPSTRTRFSFETAMKRLGGSTITAVGQDYSSLAKGETLWDTAKMVEAYADVIVVRHPMEGSARQMAEGANIPVINGGDGPGQHPTQALLDVYTLLKEKGTLDGLTVMMSGDLKYGRTVHSLLMLLRHFDVKMIFASPDELKLPKEFHGFLREKNVAFEEVSRLEDGLAKADVVYATRVQQERFSDREQYERLKLAYIISKELLEKHNPKITVMHPLPRVGEITVDTDAMPGAAYFRQAANGVPMRMALLALVLGKA